MVVGIFPEHDTWWSFSALLQHCAGVSVTHYQPSARMREGYCTWSVRLCVCVCVSVCLSVYLYSRTEGNEAARQRYTRLQRNKRSNNVADLAETVAFWQEKQAQPWTRFRDPTHQLARCACVFITRLGGACSAGSAPGRSSTAWSSALLYYATSSATSLLKNRCIR